MFLVLCCPQAISEKGEIPPFPLLGLSQKSPILSHSPIFSWITFMEMFSSARVFVLKTSSFPGGVSGGA